MPGWVQCVDFVIGVVGFIITLITLKTAYSVRKQLIHNAELSDFRNSADDIIQRIDGYIASINEDKLYISDNDLTLKPTIIQFMVDIQTRFCFLSKSTQKPLKKILHQMNNPNMLPSDWNNIANQLIKLKNFIRKEYAYYG